MVRLRTVQVGTAWGWALAVMLMIALNSGTAAGQGSTTATLRGNVQDSTGGVLPGATVTLTNTGTKAIQSTVSDDRGQYLFAGVFPAVYDLKVELAGFKTYERKAVLLGASDTRGIDVRLDVGRQTETVTVTAQTEVIQTETGAREGVLNAKQIDNLSVIGRSSLELMRILPGVVTNFNVGESVGFGSGGNDTQGYTVNGIRSSGNTVTLDGSSLIDIGSNGGVQRRHEVGDVEVPRRGVRLRARQPVRRQRSVEQHRGHTEAEEQVSVSGGQHRRPDQLRRQLYEEPRQAVLLRGI